MRFKDGIYTKREEQYVQRKRRNFQEDMEIFQSNVPDRRRTRYGKWKREVRSAAWNQLLILNIQECLRNTVYSDSLAIFILVLLFPAKVFPGLKSSDNKIILILCNICVCNIWHAAMRTATPALYTVWLLSILSDSVHDPVCRKYTFKIRIYANIHWNLTPRLSEYYDVLAVSDKRSQFSRMLDMIFALIRNKKILMQVIIDSYSYESFLVYSHYIQIKFFDIPYIPILRGGGYYDRLKSSPGYCRFVFTNSHKNISPSLFWRIFS